MKWLAVLWFWLAYRDPQARACVRAGGTPTLQWEKYERGWREVWACDFTICGTCHRRPTAFTCTCDRNFIYHLCAHCAKKHQRKHFLLPWRSQ